MKLDEYRKNISKVLKPVKNSIVYAWKTHIFGLWQYCFRMPISSLMSKVMFLTWACAGCLYISVLFRWTLTCLWISIIPWSNIPEKKRIIVATIYCIISSSYMAKLIFEINCNFNPTLFRITFPDGDIISYWKSMITILRNERGG